MNTFYFFPATIGGMISVDEAKKMVAWNVEAMPPVKMPLKNAAGFVLAADVCSAIDFPPFNQSNVDGYAIMFKDAAKKLTVTGESTAGSHQQISLKPGHAMRIFTGAPVPENADTVVMQEKTRMENNCLVIEDDQLKQGVNFRPKGKDIRKGDVAFKKDELLSAGTIGFLSSLGITEVSVYKKPSISIIITGNELQHPGKELQFGEVYEANSFMIKAALQQLHFDEAEIFYADDNLERLTSALDKALGKSDVVLLCGGISVGDYDFVLQAANNCGVEKLFHKVKQRPGKPLYFGKKQKKIVFGLPGNPSSVLTCFYEYVAEALAVMMKRESGIKTITAKLKADYAKVPELTVFLKGLLNNDEATALEAQESYRLSSYAKANCLIKLDEGRTEYKAGEEVEVHMLP
ncbi:MAG TPA: gephyrin-like molybdotransferase Glp [Chitinophagaceae bacterium]|nr:gephyrin-like molybdotransferase Glp [Chitinophagaceae bacterium]